MDDEVFEALAGEWFALRKLMDSLELNRYHATDPFLIDTLDTEHMAALMRWKHVNDTLKMARVEA